MRPAYLALMKALISLGATAHRGASLRQIRPGFRVSFDGDPAAGLGVFGGPGAGANPKEDSQKKNAKVKEDLEGLNSQ